MVLRPTPDAVVKRIRKIRLPNELELHGTAELRGLFVRAGFRIRSRRRLKAIAARKWRAACVREPGEFVGQSLSRDQSERHHQNRDFHNDQVRTRGLFRKIYKADACDCLDLWIPAE